MNVYNVNTKVEIRKNVVEKIVIKKYKKDLKKKRKKI